MAEASVVDKLNVSFGQEYRVKLGKSFTFPKENAFHAIKYDFKPLSVDSQRPGRLKVSEDEVNVALPVGQGESAEEFAQFRGGKKPCTKECVLIIDTNTGEAILERISNTVNLKVVRDGRKSVQPRDRSISPSPHMNQSKTQPPLKSQLATSSSNAPSTSSTLSAPATMAAGKSTPTSSVEKMKGVKKHNKKTPKNTLLSSVKQDGRSKATTAAGSKMKRTTPKIKKETQQRTTNSSSTNATVSSSFTPSVSSSTVSSSNTLSVPQTLTSVAMATAVAAPSMPSFSELAPPPREISPLSSNNPTPEPTSVPPPNKKTKVSLSSSSSSSSDSSDDERAGPPTLKAPPTHLLHHQHHHHHQQQQPVMAGHHQMAHMPQIPHKAAQYQGHVTTQMPTLVGQSQQMHHHHHHHQGHQGHYQQQQVRPLPTTVIDVHSSSSSDSESGSSSGSSSSDSSSDSSDQENDREVASYNRHPPPGRQMSMSLLRTDLQLSDSGSDSD